MCNKMGPNTGEWSSSEGVGFCNLIPSLISLLSKTNITPSFENYELFTGFHCNFRCCNCWSAPNAKNHFNFLSLCLSLLHTQTIWTNSPATSSHRTYMKSPAAEQPHPSQHFIMTAHWSFAFNHNGGQSAGKITPVSTVTPFVRLVNVCIPTQYVCPVCSCY